MDKDPGLTESPNLLETAHKRAPVEIWEAIFGIAIESPLIPYLNDDVVDACLLFSTRCESQRIQRCVETIRNHLRLVCRSWNACLRDKGVKLAIRSFQRGPHQRLEAPDVFRCACDRPCVGSILYLPTTFSDPPASALANLRIGIISGKYPIDVLLNAPLLQALYVTCGSLPTHILPSHQIIRALSHLQLSGMSLLATRSITGPVKFPQLRLLSLGLTTDPFVYTPVITTSPGSPLSTWILPRLQTLKLKGQVDVGYEPDISKFLSRPWTGVTSLYVDLIYVPPRNVSAPKAFEITPSLWASFPNLDTFGTHPASLAEAPPAPPGMYPRLSLVLEFVWDGFNLRGKSMIPFIQVLDEWKPVKIIFLSSWREIHTNWKISSKYSLSMWPKGFFSTALARDISLLDVNRTPMCDEDGLQCLEIILG